jgi:hypothetical protein
VVTEYDRGCRSFGKLEGIVDGGALPDTALGEPVDSATEAEPSAAEAPAEVYGASMDKDRIPKGALRAFVEDYLTERWERASVPPRSATTSADRAARSTTP